MKPSTLSHDDISRKHAIDTAHASALMHKVFVDGSAVSYLHTRQAQNAGNIVMADMRPGAKDLCLLCTLEVRSMGLTANRATIPALES